METQPAIELGKVAKIFLRDGHYRVQLQFSRAELEVTLHGVRTYENALKAVCAFAIPPEPAEPIRAQ